MVKISKRKDPRSYLITEMQGILLMEKLRRMSLSCLHARRRNRLSARLQMASTGWFSCLALILLAWCLSLCLVVSVWCRVLAAAVFCSDALIFIQLPLPTYCFSGKMFLYFISEQYIVIICHVFTWEILEVKHPPI